MEADERIRDVVRSAETEYQSRIVQKVLGRGRGQIKAPRKCGVKMGSGIFMVGGRQKTASFHSGQETRADFTASELERLKRPPNGAEIHQS